MLLARGQARRSSLRRIHDPRSKIVSGSKALKRIEQNQLLFASPGVSARSKGRPLLSTTA